MNILPFDRQVAVIAALTEGLSIRATERLTGVHRDTIMRLGMRVGFGCDTIHDALVRDVRSTLIEVDELWAFIGKKQKRVTPEDTFDKGDCYTFMAMDATHKAILAYRSGKRDGLNTEMFINDLRARVLGAPVISSDGYGPYRDTICNAFAPRLHYGQVVKTYREDPRLEAQRRYSPGAVVAVNRHIIYGQPATICTSHIERQNLSVRMASRRFTRLTNGFSKTIKNHAAAISLYVAHYNFCRVHETIRTTPALALGVTDHVWSVAELVHTASTGETPEPIESRGQLRVIRGGRA